MENERKEPTPEEIEAQMRFYRRLQREYSEAKRNQRAISRQQMRRFVSSRKRMK